MVGLLCIREAMEGGDSLLVSTTSIYNEMFDRRPDLAALLFDAIATDRRGEVPENEKPYLEIPVLNWHAGFLTGFLSAPVYRQCATLSRCAKTDAGSRRGARSL